jgi:STE24 endopeptidase
MSALGFGALFVVAVASMVAAQLWLGTRQIACVSKHRDRVPEAFAARISLAAHHKAAEYTLARQRFLRIEHVYEGAITLLLTLGGGVALGNRLTHSLAGPWNDVALVAALVVVTSVAGLPFAWWRTFVLEARFGFNRTSFATWIADLAKAAVLGVLLGGPLLLAALWLIRHGGDAWWLWMWLLWIGFQVLMLVLYPTVIAPLFNKFSPMPAGDARTRVEALLARCQFAARDLFVMDGSRRSSHGNAYFVGFGRARRIVFFDTLLATLTPAEVESVLAHELGHFKLKHVAKSLALSAVASLVLLVLLAWLGRQPWFYAGLGVANVAPLTRPGVMLALYALALPPFLYFANPLVSALSRRHEFEADAFASRNASAAALADALVKMYEDNAATLTPDRLHSAFYDSHPPASTRIARLMQPA